MTSHISERAVDAITAGALLDTSDCNFAEFLSNSSPLETELNSSGELVPTNKIHGAFPTSSGTFNYPSLLRPDEVSNRYPDNSANLISDLGDCMYAQIWHGRENTPERFETFNPTITLLSGMDARHATRRYQVEAELNSYMSLSAGWDGYSAAPPQPLAIVDAISFLRLIDLSLTPPTPQLSSTGCVGLYWDMNRLFVDIEFGGNGEYSFYAKSIDGEELLEDDVNIQSVGVHPSLMSLLRSNIA